MRSDRIDIEHMTAPGTPNRPASDWGERGEPGVRGPRCALRGARCPGRHRAPARVGAYPARGDRVAPP